MSFRFIHSSDLHLGRKFASIPQPADGNIRGRLMEARHGAIAALARAARDHGAAHVLLAGDSFDTPTPSPAIVRQAVAAMAEAADLTWWLLPGNHDNLRDAEPLWDTVRQAGHPNIAVLDADRPVAIRPGVTLLPCPVRFRAGASDPTEAMQQMEVPEGDIRIGLAHGGVTDFTDSGGAIAPDRDARARLDYLALGDWHGRMRVSDRVHYCGSPEQDRFKHGTPGVCLAVTIDAPGAAPQVSEIRTGHFHWTEIALQVTPGADAVAALAQALPPSGRRDTLLRLRLSGRARLAGRAELMAAAWAAAPDFAHFEIRADDLATEHDASDLDLIDRPGGALRIAAEALAADPDDRIARDALARLYSYVKEGAE